jgi:outer membrane immunogenic protein
MLSKILLTPICALSVATSQVFAADLPSRKSPIPVPPPIFAWTGFYMGVNAGHAWIDDPVSAYAPSSVGFSNGSTAPLEATFVGAGFMHPNGFVGGGQIGYNFQINRWVFGLEGDIQGMTSDLTRDSGYLTGFTARFNPRKVLHDVDHVNHDWFASIRGRLGYAVMDRLLVYATGGLALTNIKFSRQLNWSYLDGCPPAADGLSQCHAGEVDNTLTGWTLGGGVEFALTNNWTVKAEYLHAEFGRTDFTTLNIGKLAAGAPQMLNHSIEHSYFDIVRAGLNYKFDWPAFAPVVARF